MLPKVATQIVHSASRAAASIHQSQTIRNVFQLQTSGPSGNLSSWNNTGSSSRGNNGPGPGGAKHRTGSRFHHNTTGRTVTQVAASVLLNDGSFVQIDDRQESPTLPAVPSSHRTRVRSHSLSLSSQELNERSEKFGTLRTVQLHTRSRPVFMSAAFQTPVTSSESTGRGFVSSPRLVRRNSTSASSPAPDTFGSGQPAPAFQTRSRRSSVSSSDTLESIQSHSTTSGALPGSPISQDIEQAVEKERDLSEQLILLNVARDSGNFDIVADAVCTFLSKSSFHTVSEYNAALEALYVNCRPGEPCRLLLRVYNDMLKRSVLPNPTTFITLIAALTDRDHYVHQVIQTLEARLRRHELGASLDIFEEGHHRKRIEILRRENNFRPAMSMFSTLIAMDGNDQCPMSTYLGLLRSCAFRGHINGAIHIFSQIERRNSKAVANLALFSPIFYKYLLEAYSNGGNLQCAEEVFADYQTACSHASFQRPEDDATSLQSHVEVWNQMIQTYLRFKLPDMAVGIVEKMLTFQPECAEPRFVPPMKASTFTALLTGFCQMGDVVTAISWFDRLLQQPAVQTGDHIGHPGQLEPFAWSSLFESLASKGMTEELNRLFLIRKNQTSEELPLFLRLIVFRANMRCLDTLDLSHFTLTMEYLIENIVFQDGCPAYVISEICDAYLSRNMPQQAVALLAQFIDKSLSDHTLKKGITTIATLRKMQLSTSKHVYEKTLGCIPFKYSLSLARLADKLRVAQEKNHISLFLHSYGLSRNANTLCDMSLRDWELLLYAAVEVERAAIRGQPIHTFVEGFAFKGVTSLLGDISNNGFTSEQMNGELVQRVVQVIEQQHGFDRMQVVFHSLGPSFAGVLKNDTTSPSVEHTKSENPWCLEDNPPIPVRGQLRITSYQTKAIHSELHSVDGALRAYKKFRFGVEHGVVPAAPAIGTLIEHLGRRHLVHELRHTYAVAQAVSRELDPDDSLAVWFIIENSMVIGLAHHGDVEAAHVHRFRILERGGAPTADAYGALISYVKDTTDDTSNAVTLFQESQRLGVLPNQYLYNNIISKLAKARKADAALGLFQRMKIANVPPSSVTYGAVIGACTRVGDAQSAEELFAEMTAASSFKPRVPPYNTMMQLYTTTKPNRERALHYYDELRKAKIDPSGHTYKLLLDAYGSIEPIEIDEMERVFQDLQKDKNVLLQGTHFASLINAYGCVQKNLDKAIHVFNSIPSYPNSPQPDALVFEAMINALVANRQTHLMSEWVGKMNASGVPMTAYIANFLIKGYSMVGDIGQARRIFESLEDPPEGVSAHQNYLPHDPSASSMMVPKEPTYREPSTWEAMVRAELGSGNRSGALDLLERLKMRQFPEAVYNRISGILVDHTAILS